MSNYNISTRYANALMNFAEENNNLEQVSLDMELVSKTLEQSKELRAVLRSPIISENKKVLILKGIFEGKIGSDSENFFQFVVGKNRAEILLDILLRFNELYNLKKGRVKAAVTSSIELSENQKKEFIKSLEKFTNKEVIGKFLLDESIIGGFVIKIDDTVVDSSIKNQLKNLRNKFFEQSSVSN